jgi:hypothetical protein
MAAPQTPSRLPAVFAYSAQQKRAATAAYGPARDNKSPLARYVSECLRAAREAKDSSEKVTYQWRRNFDAYMGRSAASSEKQDWQADQRVSRVPLFVERFAATIRGHLDNAERLYDFNDPLDPGNRLEGIVRPFVDYLLSRAGTTKDGSPVSFSVPIGTALKWGATKMVALSVTIESGRVRVDAVDPEELYYDPTGRGLYRIREYETDAHVVERWATLRDVQGKPIYDPAAIRQALAGGSHRTDNAQFNAGQQTGEPRYDEGPARKTAKIVEYVGVLLDANGKEVLSNCVVVQCNDNWIIRSPEINPYWHGQDWIIAAPMLDVPGSIYGRSYVELFEQLSGTFEELTNLVLDGVSVSSIPSYVYFPELLENPEDLANGVRPGQAYEAKRGAPTNAKPLQALEPGRMNDQVFQVWQAIGKLEQDAAATNEIALGNLAPGEKTAREISGAMQGAQQMLLNIASDLEEQVLNRVISLVWLTGLQALTPDDIDMQAVLGPERFAALILRRADFFQRRIALRVKAISGQMRRKVELQDLIGMLGLIFQNPLMTQEFLKTYSVARLTQRIIGLFGIDSESFRKTPAELQQDALMAQLGQTAAAQAGQAGEAPRNPQGPAPAPPQIGAGGA